MNNEFFTGVQGDYVVFLKPVPQRISKEQAVDLAVSLVVMTGVDFEAFADKIQEAMQ